MSFYFVTSWSQIVEAPLFHIFFRLIRLRLSYLAKLVNSHFKLFAPLDPLQNLLNSYFK